MGLADGSTISQMAEELDISRQTVSSIGRRFAIFRLDGINVNTPRLGRKLSIIGEAANEVLLVPLVERPADATQWTIRQLAKRCDLSPSTTHRFLKKKGVALDDLRTIHNAIDEANPNILDVAGLFLSPSVSVMVFGCESMYGTALAGGLTSTTIFPMENIPVFFSRESEGLLGQLEVLQEELLWVKSQSSNLIDLMLFLEILSKKRDRRKEIILIADTLEFDNSGIMLRWLESHPRFHLKIALEPSQWSGTLRECIGSVRGRDKMIIALQLENLAVRLTEWRNGPQWNLGEFASTAPFWETLR